MIRTVIHGDMRWLFILVRNSTLFKKVKYGFVDLPDPGRSF